MKPIVVDGPRMSDIAEQAESLLLKEFLLAELERGREVLGVHLWTHSPRRFTDNPHLVPLLQTLRERSIPLALQVSVTGLGGTDAEPGIEPPEEGFAHLRRLRDSGLLPPERVCLRMDPFQSWQGKRGRITNTDRIDSVLSAALEIGIRRVRTSLIVYGRYRSRIQPRARARELIIAPLDREEIGNRLRDWIGRGMDVRSCAFDLSREGIPPGACFDFPWVTGLPLEEPLKPVAARSGCRCHVPKAVKLWKVPRRSVCAGGCLACYAQEHAL